MDWVEYRDWPIDVIGDLQDAGFDDSPPFSYITKDGRFWAGVFFFAKGEAEQERMVYERRLLSEAGKFEGEWCVEVSREWFMDYAVEILTSLAEDDARSDEIERQYRNQPDQTALYRHWSTDDDLLYIGISLNPFSRTKEHSKTAKWFQDVAQITIEWHASRGDAAAAEVIAIRGEKPMHNITHNTRRRQCSH